MNNNYEFDQQSMAVLDPVTRMPILDWVQVDTDLRTRHHLFTGETPQIIGKGLAISTNAIPNFIGLDVLDRQIEMTLQTIYEFQRLEPSPTYFTVKADETGLEVAKLTAFLFMPIEVCDFYASTPEDLNRISFGTLLPLWTAWCLNEEGRSIRPRSPKSCAFAMQYVLDGMDVDAAISLTNQ